MMTEDKCTLAPRVSRRSHLGRAARGARGRRLDRAKTIAALPLGTVGAIGSVGMTEVLNTFSGAGTPTAEAVPNQFLDVPSTFQMMRDARDRVLNYRAAVKAVEDGRANLKAARANLAQAKSDRQEAIAGLAEAQAGLKSSQGNLIDILAQLPDAREASEARTREAIAAQQAVADFEPAYYAQQTRVQELAARLSRLEANRPYTASASGVASTSGVISGADSTRAERIRREWERVGYEPGYLEEIRTRVDRDIAAEVAGDVYADDGGAAAEEAEAYEAEVEAAQSEYDEAEAELSELQSEYESLVDARADAEAEEADARQAVRELEAEKVTAIADTRAAQDYLASAEEYDRATITELATAETEVATSEREYREADHYLKHFGEGIGATMSTEYYHWSGEHSNGHQLVTTYGADYEFTRGSVALATGTVNGSLASFATDARNNTSGSVGHLTDTTLSATYKNDNKVNDTHYTLEFNLPTGDSDASPFASVPSLLARYTTYGEGFNVTPSIEGIHHINETDSVALRGSYSWRGGYDTQGYSDGYESAGTWVPISTSRSRVSPGDQARLQLSYLHAGEQEQLYSFVAYQHNKDTRTHNLTTGEYSTVRDGDGWEWAIYYNEHLSRRTEWQSYLFWTRDGATAGSTSALNRGLSYYGMGTGLRRELAPGEHVSLMTQYLIGHGASDSWRTGLGNEDPRRLSVLLGYEKRIDDRDSLQLRVERYTLHDKSSGNYNGWSTGMFFSRSF